MTGSGLPDGPLVAWYGDDFTGAAAVMEALTFAGLPSVVFLDAPSAALAARFGDARGVGIAGDARARPPEWMDAHLPGIFAWLAATGAPVLQYKFCSTLDSAPHVGSIGRALEIARRVRPTSWCPVLVAAPEMGRHQAFGTLFVRAPHGVERLDRHPVMSRHPVTPMDEADVRRHLARQTSLPIGLIDLTALRSPDGGRARLEREVEADRVLVALDAVEEEDMRRCGELIWSTCGTGHLCAGSQGVEQALVRHWRAQGLLPPAPAPDPPAPARRTIAAAGSVSTVTAEQVAVAEAAGSAVIRLDPAAILRGDGRAERAAMDAAEGALADRSVVLCTARGPNDPAVAAFAEACAGGGVPPDEGRRRIGAALGRTMAALVARTGCLRLAVAGGDTSAEVTRALEVRALTILAPLATGAPLCLAHRDAGPPLELALKGGQMGGPDFLLTVAGIDRGA